MNLKKEAPFPVFRARLGAFFFTLFFIPFLFGGAFLMYQESLRPYLKAKDAVSTWARVPAVVTTSEVKRSKSSDGASYRVHIEFRYKYEGAFYEGGNYDFSKVYSSGKKDKVELSQKFPVGKETFCYVNPQYPEEAVLLPEGAKLNWFLVFFAGLFVIIGLGGMGAGFYHLVWPKVLRDKEKTVSNPFAVEADPQKPSRRELMPINGRLAGSLSLILICLFWNSITGIFVTLTIKEWLEGSGNWVVTVFMVPFVFVGVLLFVAAGYQLLRVFSPKPRLFLSICPLGSGETAGLEWSFNTGSRNLKRLKLTLLCREEATKRRGEDSTTEKEVVYKESLIDTSEKILLWVGEVDVRLPEFAVPNFESKHNKVQWILHVEGEVSGLPDVSDEYLVPVAVVSYTDVSKGERI